MVGGISGTQVTVRPTEIRNKVVEFTFREMYGEAAFRYLLNVEAKRSQRSGFGYYLLFLYQPTNTGVIGPMKPQVVRPVLATLSRCLRETDYVGWFREGSIVCAVLTAMGKESNADHPKILKTRIEEMLQAELGAEDSGKLLVRICSHDDWVAGAERELGQVPFHV